MQIKMKTEFIAPGVRDHVPWDAFFDSLKPSIHEALRTDGRVEVTLTCNLMEDRYILLDNLNSLLAWASAGNMVMPNLMDWNLCLLDRAFHTLPPDPIAAGGVPDVMNVVSLVCPNAVSVTSSLWDVLPVYRPRVAGSMARVAFPECKEIGGGAFGSFHGLAAVDFPVCETIADHAFLQCGGITKVHFPECTGIGDGAFSGCAGLVNVRGPECLGIGVSAFESCASLLSADLSKCAAIGVYAFRDCKVLPQIHLPACATIPANAFSNCESLAAANLGACVSVGSDAFSNCPMLRTLLLPQWDPTAVGTGVSVAAFNPDADAVYWRGMNMVVRQATRWWGADDEVPLRNCNLLTWIENTDTIHPEDMDTGFRVVRMEAGFCRNHAGVIGGGYEYSNFLDQNVIHSVGAVTPADIQCILRSMDNPGTPPGSIILLCTEDSFVHLAGDGLRQVVVPPDIDDVVIIVGAAKAPNGPEDEHAILMRDFLQMMIQYEAGEHEAATLVLARMRSELARDEALVRLLGSPLTARIMAFMDAYASDVGHNSKELSDLWDRLQITREIIGSAKNEQRLGKSTRK